MHLSKVWPEGQQVAIKRLGLDEAAGVVQTQGLMQLGFQLAV
jgi:hypothetical protein